VARQRNDPDSLLFWLERLIRLRKECPEIGWGAWKVLPTGRKAVLAVRLTWRDSTTVSLHNFSQHPCTLRFAPTKQSEQSTPLLNLLNDEVSLPQEDGRHRITLEGYGFRWYRLGTRDSGRLRNPEPEP